MNALPANIDAASARLPESYESAKTALAQCASLDECKAWTDKAAALASYARQANDKALERFAHRIKLRAIDQSGKILKEIDAQGKRTDREELREGDRPKLSQKEAASAAGMSSHQTKQAVRVASVPKDSFEEQVESSTPPTVTALAKQGTKPAPPFDYLKGRDPKEFNQAMHYLGPIREYAKEVEGMTHDTIIPILTSEERAELRAIIARIDSVHANLVARL